MAHLKLKYRKKQYYFDKRDQIELFNRMHFKINSWLGIP